MTASVVVMEALVAGEGVITPDDLINPVTMHIDARRSPGIGSLLKEIPPVVMEVCCWIGVNVTRVAHPTLHATAQRIVTEIRPPHVCRPDIHWLVQGVESCRDPTILHEHAISLAGRTPTADVIVVVGIGVWPPRPILV